MSGASRRLAVLGSTGTIGRHTLDVVGRLDGRFRIVALAGGRNLELLAEQIRVHRPDRAAVAGPEGATELRERLGRDWRGEILVGEEGLVALAGDGCDVVVNGLVGILGLAPSLAALEGGADLALANKESLVVAGGLLRRACDRNPAPEIHPIHSEHSGLWQCLEGRPRGTVRRIVLTASGGPFRTLPLDRLAEVRPEEALRHPTWKMGPRITIDSATLLNKGFEVIEAHWLFDFPDEEIDVWIHPQSLVHALVELNDGSLLAQISATDMRLPIQLALCHPDRPATALPRLDLSRLGPLEFAPVEPERYPAFALARRALREGGTAGAVLNGADEALVAAFLERRIPFPAIPRLLGRILDERPDENGIDLASIRRADRWARDRARELAAST
ncbi:MAG: 1-deoxy-D-xylulose-5-phosphate reductoisomerase [Candidatus Eisenbacteria bacterium]|nr:1-deoxy-D-xylulose-5-phosphate reductoisomerase [Candidatus Latescibacterota bacterium]MBD3303483.1 1-deoxy-D-xylulose-5-phosphate reductoisomerase [Candidatus Eisenbacteria bacterium]